MDTSQRKQKQEKIIQVIPASKIITITIIATITLISMNQLTDH
jgi:hypothetical protein